MAILQQGRADSIAINSSVNQSAETRACRTDAVLSRDAALPGWLETELRSDHAGETGAVAIYEGILKASSDADVCEFARRHRVTELEHLQVMNSLLPASRRSRLLPLWSIAGFVTGALPALFGPNAVYATIDAVETFVDGHYQQQIDKLANASQWRKLGEALDACRRDDVLHRDEARRAQQVEPGFVLRLWLSAVSTGSALAVRLARRI